MTPSRAGAGAATTSLAGPAAEEAATANGWFFDFGEESRSGAEAALRGQPLGTFLVRRPPKHRHVYSTRCVASLVLSVVAQQKTVHFKLECLEGGEGFDGGPGGWMIKAVPENTYANLTDLIDFHHATPLFFQGITLCDVPGLTGVDIKQACLIPSPCCAP